MKKILCTSIALALFQTAGLAHAEFSNHDFHGHYGYSFSADPILPTDQDNFVTEVGVFWADGNGNLSGTGDTMGTNGGFINSDVTYDCTYTVDPNGTGTSTCALTRDGNTEVGVLFFFVIDDESAYLLNAHIDNRQEVRFHSKNKLPFVIPSAGVDQEYHAIGSARRQ